MFWSSGQVGFVPDQQPWQFFLLKKRDKFQVAVGKTADTICNEYGDIRLCKRLARFLYTFFSEHAKVVEAWCVDDDNRTKRKEFHRFLNRVSRCAWDIGDDGKLLTCDCIDKAGFPGIPASEKSDVNTLGGRGILKTHMRYIPFWDKITAGNSSTFCLIYRLWLVVILH